MERNHSRACWGESLEHSVIDCCLWCGAISPAPPLFSLSRGYYFIYLSPNSALELNNYIVIMSPNGSRRYTFIVLRRRPVYARSTSAGHSGPRPHQRLLALVQCRVYSQ